VWLGSACVWSAEGKQARQLSVLGEGMWLVLVASKAPPRPAMHATQRRVDGSWPWAVRMVRQRLWGVLSGLSGVEGGRVSVGWGAPAAPSSPHPGIAGW